MNNVTTIGIDLAKNVFQVCGVDSRGKTLFQKPLSRTKLSAFMAQHPSVLVGMEACGGAHHWARTFTEFGHVVKLMAPQYVKPYVKTHKNDAHDALACAEAVTRPNMRFVPIKTSAQQDLLSLHRVRSFFIKQRTAIMNHTRGLLAEQGITCQITLGFLLRKLLEVIDDGSFVLSPLSKTMFRELYDEIKHVDEKVKRTTKQIEQFARADHHCQLLQTIIGIGPLTSTALVASIGNGSGFDSGRGLSAWLGLVPKQHSSGGKERLLGISKRGDCYIRQLAVHGARSVVKAALIKDKQDKHSLWIRSLVERCGKNKATVALANKNVRIAWAVLTQGTMFNPELAHRDSRDIKSH